MGRAWVGGVFSEGGLQGSHIWRVLDVGPGLGHRISQRQQSPQLRVWVGRVGSRLTSASARGKWAWSTSQGEFSESANAR